MSATLEDVTKKRPELCAEQVAAEDLMRQAREQGLSLTGPDGLLPASVPGSSRTFAGPVVLLTIRSVVIYSYARYVLIHLLT